MERRGPSDMQSTAGSALVAPFTYEQPLLPYERHLIEILGISEQEYRKFAEEIAVKGRRRAAEYDHIPDIRCDPVLTPILINLAIGAVLTGISMLLAPKPPSLDNDDGITQRNLGDQKGRTRFNQSIGFDGAPQLATMGSRIPLLFGRYEENDPDSDVEGQIMPSGGLLAEPLLVWSRMTSNGSYQSIRAQMVIGNSKVSTPPELPGIFIGGQPIDNIYSANYAVAWSSQNGKNIMRLADVLYGQMQQGDWPAGIFNCATFAGFNEAGFSMALTPANTRSFGVYQPLPNGGRWSVNWRVVSIPRGNDNNGDPDRRLQNERRKIAGRNADAINKGMNGTGRAYSPKCGVVSVNGVGYTEPTELEVNLGDTITYQINGGSFIGQGDFDAESGVNADDLEDTCNSIRERADSLLRWGEIFMIYRSIFRVTSRPADVWQPGKDFNYQLTCIDFIGNNRTIGVIGTNNLNSFILWEGGDVEPDLTKYRGSNWFNLCKVDIAQVKNTRPTEVTELGIKSQVWQQANGLCNFSNIPDPSRLEHDDWHRIQVNAGAMNLYLPRSSFFVLAVRNPNSPVGVDSQGTDTSPGVQGTTVDGFEILWNVVFCVRGNSPVDAYNYIRIQHPQLEAYEYRLIPKDSRDVIDTKNTNPLTTYVLDPTAPLRSVTMNTSYYGTFRLEFGAALLPVEDLLVAPWMQAGGQERMITRLDCSATGLIHTGNHSVDSSRNGGREQAFWECILGNLWGTGMPASQHARNGDVRTRQFNIDVDSSVRITMGITGTCILMDESWKPRNGTRKLWRIDNIWVKSSTGGVREGQKVHKFIGPNSTGTPPPSSTGYGAHFGVTFTDQAFEITGVSCQQITEDAAGTRTFEWNAQAKERSAYSELRKSCESAPEHQIVYINESQANASPATYPELTMLGIKLRSLNQVSTFNQVQVWLPNGMDVKRLVENDVGPSNNFADVVNYLLTETGAGLGGEIGSKLIDKKKLSATARFQRNYWMRYDGAISDRVNIRDYLTSIAPLFLTNFVVANGKFALVPGLPVDSAGQLITGPVPIAQYFNDSNIIEGSFDLEYLPQGDRRKFRAVMKYRRCKRNALVETETVLVEWDEPQAGSINQEDYDMSAFCTRRSHAMVAARYLLSMRRRVDHTISFQTLPAGLSLSPGDYIRFDSAASPYTALANGVVKADGSILSASPPPDGSHFAYVYRQGSTEVTEETIEIADGQVADPDLVGALFNVPKAANPTTPRHGVYLVEEISLTEEGLVDITASHFPVDAAGASTIVADVLDRSRFKEVD